MRKKPSSTTRTRQTLQSSSETLAMMFVKWFVFGSMLPSSRNSLIDTVVMPTALKFYESLRLVMSCRAVSCVLKTYVAVKHL